MTQKRYTLSDADMLGIFERIDSATSASDVIAHGIVGTWNAILGQEGSSFVEYHVINRGPLNPAEYAIPHDQTIEITERMKRQMLALGVSEIGIASMLLDWANVGPSTYNDMPQAWFHYGTADILPPPSNPPMAALAHIPPPNIGAHPSIVDKSDLVEVEFPDNNTSREYREWLSNEDHK